MNRLIVNLGFFSLFRHRNHCLSLIIRYSYAFVVIGLAGCSSVQVEKGIPVSVQGLAGKVNNNTGRAIVNIRARSPIMLDEFYASNGDIYFLQKNGAGLNVDNYILYNVTGRSENKGDSCYVGGNYGQSSLEKCKKEIIKKNGLIKSVSRGKNEYLATSNDTYVLFKPQLDRSTGSLTVEYIDYSNDMASWKSRYPNIQQGNIGDYSRYAEEFPGSSHANTVMTDMFNKFFSIKIIAKKESSERPITSSGLLSSYAGSCKDIIRTIEIGPNVQQFPSRSLSLNVEYVLRRTYKPHQLESDDDPISLNKAYTLDNGNGFRLKDDVSFNCVLTSGRFHAAGLSLIGKLVGAKSTGIETTLSKINFAVDVKSVR